MISRTGGDPSPIVGIFTSKTVWHESKVLVGDAAYWAMAQFVLTRLTAVEAAVVTSHQYILTLWPAFVGAICALGPDPACMVYDNVWWAILYSMTCAGLPGVSTMKPPHHVVAISTGQGRDVCEHWRPAKHTPREVSRSWVLAGTPARPSLVVLEWICFLFCIALYLGFSVWFVYVLRDSVVIAFDETRYWLACAAWYWISPCPAMAAILLSEIWQHRVELYEPQELGLPTHSHDADTQGSGVVSTTLLPKASASAVTGLPMSAEAAKVLAVPYYKADTPTVLHVWSRVIMHQWRRRYYRLLVKPSSNHPYFLLVRIFVGMVRVTVFVLGSVWMGDILLMPIPQDLGLLTLLLCTSVIPRLVFPGFWSNGARGADLIVFVKPIGIVDG